MTMAEHTFRKWVAPKCLSRSELVMTIGWTCIQHVSYFLYLIRFKPLTRMDEHVFRMWVALQFERIYTTDHASSLWVTLQCLRLLTSRAKHASRMWVSLQCLSRSEPLKTMAEHASRMWVSLSSVWVYLNHCKQWLTWNMQPGCELLSRVWADLNHWWEWLNMHQDQKVSHSPEFEWM